MDRHIRKRLGVLACCCVVNLVAFCQDEKDISLNNQFWFDYNLSYQFSEKWVLNGDLGFRTIVPHRWNRYIIGAAMSFNVPKLILKEWEYKEELHGGIHFYYTTNFDASNRLEIRPFQGYRLTWPDLDRLRLRHYLRLEERFDLNTSNWKNTFGLRVRYLAELTIKLQGDAIDETKGIYLPLSIEPFWNLIGTRQFNDHLRIASGIGYGFSDNWKAEFQLAYHYARNTVQGEFNSSDFVYRFRAFYQLN